MKIPTPIFKYIEYELFSYDDTIKLIDEIKMDVIESSPVMDGIRVSGDNNISDPTGKKGIKLISSKAIGNMVRVVSGVDRALEKLNEDHLMVFELKYRQGLKWQDVCNEMPVSERSFFRLRKEIIVSVGLELGLVKSCD